MECIASGTVRSWVYIYILLRGTSSLDLREKEHNGQGIGGTVVRERSLFMAGGGTEEKRVG